MIKKDSVTYQQLCMTMLWLTTLLLTGTVYAKQMQVNAVTYISSEKENSLTIGVTELPVYHAFLVDNPPRLIIDINDAKIDRPVTQPRADQSMFTGLRAGINKGINLRLVADLSASANIKSLSLKSTIKDSQYLFISLINNSQENAIKKITQSRTIKSNSKTKSDSEKPIVIALDAGHGGNDPGARGSHGTNEKAITLSIAKKLAGLINKTHGMEAILVRNDDRYLSLRQRINIARKAEADLFVSIHADAFQDINIKGASVYTLSTSGASSEAARWLATSENAADLIGTNLSDKDNLLAAVLFDLSQAATQSASSELAKSILFHLGQVTALHKEETQSAGFIVLKSPDIPSILIETAFISNPEEELNLVSEAHQKRLSKAIFSGIIRYFKKLPPDSRLAKIN